MIVMEQMLDDKNYDRLKLYMQKLADIAHENEQKIDTGNIELDAILNNKINEAQDSNIKTETDITIPAGIIKDGYDKRHMDGGSVTRSRWKPCGLG